QQSSWSMSNDQEQRTRRRLLENLEESVGGANAHVIGGVDNGDAPAPFACGRAKERHRSADVLDRQKLLEAFSILVQGTLENQQVGVRKTGDAPERPVVNRCRQCAFRT